jgi:hypothetical protein
MVLLIAGVHGIDDRIKERDVDPKDRRKKAAKEGQKTRRVWESEMTGSILSYFSLIKGLLGTVTNFRFFEFLNFSNRRIFFQPDNTFVPSQQAAILVRIFVDYPVRRGSQYGPPQKNLQHRRSALPLPCFVFPTFSTHY